VIGLMGALLALAACTPPAPIVRTMRLEVQPWRAPDDGRPPRNRIVEVRHHHDPVWAEPCGALAQARFFDLLTPGRGFGPQAVLRLFWELDAVEFVVENPPRIRLRSDGRVLVVGFTVRTTNRSPVPRSLTRLARSHCWLPAPALESHLSRRLAQSGRRPR